MYILNSPKNNEFFKNYVDFVTASMIWNINSISILYKMKKRFSVDYICAFRASFRENNHLFAI